MKSIWKFPLEVTDEQVVQMPRHWVPLAVSMQGQSLCLWALVDTEAEPRPYVFRIYGTGHSVETGPDHRYIGTAHDTGQGFVWHVFLNAKPPVTIEGGGQ